MYFWGAVEHVSHENEKAIKMVWQLFYPMLVEIFEEKSEVGEGKPHLEIQFSLLQFFVHT